MNFIENKLRQVDAFQQKRKVPSLIYATVKKYGDDNATSLTIQLTYTMFVTVFPLLLLLVTILTLVLVDHPSVRASVLKSTFDQFPVIGSQLSGNIHVLKRDSIVGLVVGIVGLIYGSTGLAGAGIYAMENVWNIEGALRLNYIKRLARSLVFLLVLALGLIVTTLLSSFGTYSKHNLWLTVLSEILALAANIALFVAAYRALTPKTVSTKSMIPGSVIAGLLWTILQAVGGFVVGHYLRNDNATYGTFSVIFGLLAWLYLGATITIYCAEFNTILKKHLWPRSIVQPPLTKADQESIALQAVQNRRRPEQHVITRVMGEPMTQADYLKNGGRVDKKKVGTTKVAPKKRSNKHKTK